MKSKNIFLIAAGVLVIVAFILILRSPSEPVQPGTNTPDQSTSGSVTATPGTPVAPTPKPPATTSVIKNALVVRNQKPGTSVLIESVTLEKAGYVAVFEERGETLGEILAVTPLLTRGTHAALSLKATLSPGAAYRARLYLDNGDKVFALSSDQLAKNASGATLSIAFSANVDVVSQNPQSYTIGMRNYAFTPATLTAKKGDLVIFTNMDSMLHTVTAAAFGGQHVLELGKSYVVNTANLARGTYQYRCDFHPNMTGSLTIE